MENIISIEDVNQQKSITIEDLTSKSLDDIIELYRYGYTLKDDQSQSSINVLQLPSIELSGAVFLGGVLAGLLLMLMIRGKVRK